MKHLVFIILLLTFGFIFSGGCNKDEDISPPGITISKPSPNQSFAAIDTIFVDAEIYDNIIIKTVSISILDEDLLPVSPTDHYDINSQNTNIKTFYEINNIHLVSGYYYLQVSASDGINTGRSFIKIYISEIPIERTGIYIFSEESGNTQVFKIAPDFSIQFIFNFYDEFQDAEINSYFQQLYLLGKNNGIMQACEISSCETLWQVSGINNVLYPFLGQLDILDNLVFISYSDGNIIGYDNTGTGRYSFTITDNQFKPGRFYKHKDFLIVEEQSISFIDNRIEVFYYYSFSPMQHYDVDIDIVDFYSFNDDKVIIFGNKNDIAEVCTLSVYYQQIGGINGFPDEKIHSVISTENNVYLLAMGDHIYKYNGHTNGLTVYLQDKSADILKFDYLYNDVFIIKGDSLSIMSYPGNIFHLDYKHPNPILDVEILYNR